MINKNDGGDNMVTIAMLVFATLFGVPMGAFVNGLFFYDSSFHNITQWFLSILFSIFFFIILKCDASTPVRKPQNSRGHSYLPFFLGYWLGKK